MGWEGDVGCRGVGGGGGWGEDHPLPLTMDVPAYVCMCVCLKMCVCMCTQKHHVRGKFFVIHALLQGRLQLAGEISGRLKK